MSQEEINQRPAPVQGIIANAYDLMDPNRKSPQINFKTLVGTNTIILGINR